MTLNLRPGVIDGIKLLQNHFQVVIFSRETIEDSWAAPDGGQYTLFNVQNKMIKDFLSQQPDLKIDGYYVSLQSTKVQSLTDDYSQIFVDFGVTQKIKQKVLFVNCLAN